MCHSPSWTLYIQFGGVSYVYQLYFRAANLLDDLDFISSSFLDGSRPGRSKSTYETILSLIWSFNGQRLSFHPLVKRQRPWRFAYHLDLLLRVDRFVSIKISRTIHAPCGVHLLHICSLFIIFCISYLFLLHPPPPGLCGMQKWNKLIIITISISSTYVMFWRWIKKNMRNS